MAQGFVKPYPQLALDGALGLTTAEIAAAIGVSHKTLLRDFRRRGYLKWLRDADFRLAPFGAKTGNCGRKPIHYAVETEAAKAIVAQSRTELGIGYLRYLLACERAVEAVVPRLLSEVADLRAKLEALMAPKRMRGPGRRHRVVAGFRTVRDLFGNEEKVPVYRELALGEMTDEERRAYESQHLAKISSGASKKAAQLINHEVKPGRRSAKVLALAPKPTKETTT